MVSDVSDVIPNAVKILVAGRGEFDGVDGYVHVGTDALGVLRDTLKTLGVGA